MSGDSGERVKLNFRVDTNIKRAFEDCVREKYGKATPYAGFELESELRYFLDIGPLANLKASVDSLASSQEIGEEKEKVRKAQRDQSEPVCYRVLESVREQIKFEASNDFRSPGRLVEAIMYRYTIDGCVVQRLTEYIESVEVACESGTRDSLGAVERRTKGIVNQLNNSNYNVGFSLSDFNEAVESVDAISPSTYVRNQYLPLVLDEMGYTWDEKNDDFFINTSLYEIPEVRDVSNKPYYLMDESDKKLIIELVGYRKAQNTGYATLSINEAIDELEGRPKQKTVRSLMNKIGDTSPGYSYDSNRGLLKINRDKIVNHESANSDLLKIINR